MFIRTEVKQWVRRGLAIVLPLWQLQTRDFEEPWAVSGAADWQHMRKEPY